MLNIEQLKEYRELRGVTQKAVAKECDLTQAFISMLESGKRELTRHSYDEYRKGVNLAYKKNK